MRPITEHVFSHIMEKRNFPPGKWYAIGDEINGNYGYSPSSQSLSISQIRKNPGYEVKKYKDLVPLIAELANRNHRYNLMYRGQSKDYTDSKGQTIVYPSIFRPRDGEKRILKKEIEKRFNDLYNLINKLKKSPLVKTPLFRYREFYMALLQHYQLCRTPLIDLTLSLHVATTFALHGTDTGYLLVFAMPYPYGSISHYVDDNIVMVKLQSVCPHYALRPHFQEGWLAGRLDINPSKEEDDNLARRLIGKYKLDNRDGQFWDDDYKPIPMNALMPEIDEFLDKLKNLLKLP